MQDRHKVHTGTQCLFFFWLFGLPKIAICGVGIRVMPNICEIVLKNNCQRLNSLGHVQNMWVRLHGVCKHLLHSVGDLLILNKGDGSTQASPCPDTPMYTLLTIKMTFLILQFHFIQLSSFSTYNGLFITELKYWVSTPLNCMQWTEFIQAGFSYVSHTWNFLLSKILEGHSMNIVQNSRAWPTYLMADFIYLLYLFIQYYHRYIGISKYIVRYVDLIFKNYKYRMEKVTPAGCVSTWDKIARKCNSYLTNG